MTATLFIVSLLYRYYYYYYFYYYYYYYHHYHHHHYYYFHITVSPSSNLTANCFLLCCYAVTRSHQKASDEQ